MLKSIDRSQEDQHCELHYISGRLCDIMVSVLATGSKVPEFKPGRSDVLLMAIKIFSKPIFEEEVKPEDPCRKTLRHVKYQSRV
jgi:hypothetical protein